MHELKNALHDLVCAIEEWDSKPTDWVFEEMMKDARKALAEHNAPLIAYGNSMRVHALQEVISLMPGGDSVDPQWVCDEVRKLQKQLYK